MAIKTTALIGFVGILISAAFQKSKLDLRWMLGVILINTALIAPKTHLIITDRVIPANSAVVENIPLGIGATATIFNRFGDWLTRSFETVFALPNEIKYSENGLLFAQTLVEESTRFEITTARASSNLTDFWKSCAYYDIFLGLYSWDEVLKATDLVDFFSRKTSKSRAFTYENTNNERVVIPCREGFNNYLKADIEKELNNATKVNGAKLISKSTERREFTERLNEAVTRFSTAMPVAYKYLTNLTLSNSQILSQNVLANSFKRGLMNFATDADAAAAAEDFSMAKAEAERRTTFSVMGKLAKKMLPILHNIFESLIYAIFPIVMLMAMLSNASKILLQYAKALFWVNLWPPLYAILHFSISYHSQKAASVAMVADGNGFLTGLSIMTNTELGNVLSDYAAITGYLSLSIPMISWLVINASGSMMASLAGRLMDGYEHPTSSAAAEARSGNVNMGQYNYQNQSAFQNSVAPQSTEGTMRIQGSDGVSENITSKGTYLNSPTSSLPMSIDTSKSFSEAHRNISSSLKSSEQATMSENSNIQSHGLGQLSSLGHAMNESKGLSESFSSADRHSLSEANDTAMRTYLEMAKREGIDERTAVDNAVHLGLNAGGGLDVMILKAGAGVNQKIGKSIGGSSSQSINKSRHILQSEQFNKTVRDELVKSKDILARNSSDWAQSQSNSISNTINQMDQISLRRTEIAREMQQLSDLKEHSNQFTATISHKNSDAFSNWVIESKHIPRDQFSNLLTNSNQGDFYARQEMNALGVEFTESQIKDYISHGENHSNNDHDLISANKITQDYKKQSNSFVADHKIDSRSTWKDESKYKDHIGQVENHPTVTSDPSALKEMNNTQNEFDKKKAEIEEKYDDGFIKNYADQKYKDITKDFKNVFTKH